jgi:ParB family chromosome partitioning protein
MSGITQIEIGLITTSLQNTRKHIDVKSIEELAEDIKIRGIMQAIAVRPIGDKFEIIYGNRRFLAAKEANLKEIPCTVHVATDEEAEDMHIAENLQRVDISPLDEATAYQQLIDHRNYTPGMIALRFGKSETYIRHRLQLNMLIDDFAKLLDNEIITLGHALELCKINPDDQADYYKNYVSDYEKSYFKLESVAGLRISIQRKYTCKLSLASFKLDAAYICNPLPCLQCPHNTAFNLLLFPEMNDEGYCMNPVCFNGKTNEHTQSEIARILEEKPGIKLIVPGYLYGQMQADVDNLIKNGLMIENTPSHLVCEKPEEPIKEDYDMNDPEQVEEYNDACHEYDSELEEYTKTIASGNVRESFVVAGPERGKYVYVENREPEGGSGSAAPDAALLSEIKELKAKIDRNNELQFERTYLETFSMVKENQYPLIEDPLTELEKDTLIGLMFYACGYEFAKSVGIPLTQGREIFNQVKQLDKAQRRQVMRHYILNKTNTSQPNYMVGEAKVLLQIAAERYEKQTSYIAESQAQAYAKRNQSNQARIEELERMQLELAV